MWPYPSGHGRRAAVTTINEGHPMTVSSIITVVDRFALSLMNAIALVGIPLVAIGVLTQAL
jgi:hypothetical protein